MTERQDCLVARCPNAATEDLVVSFDPIMVVYAICATHMETVHKGSMVEQSVDVWRGLVGLRAT